MHTQAACKLKHGDVVQYLGESTVNHVYVEGSVTYIRFKGTTKHTPFLSTFSFVVLS